MIDCSTQLCHVRAMQLRHLLVHKDIVLLLAGPCQPLTASTYCRMNGILEPIACDMLCVMSMQLYRVHKHLEASNPYMYAWGRYYAANPPIVVEQPAPQFSLSSQAHDPCKFASYVSELRTWFFASTSSILACTHVSWKTCLVLYVLGPGICV